MNRPTFGSLFRLFVPLGIGMFLVSVEAPIQNAVLARLPQPELALATFSVALSFSIFTESPIISMLQLSTALSHSPAAVAMVRRYCWTVAVVLVAVAWAIAATPLYALFVVKLLAIPADLAAAIRLPFAILASTPLVIGIRRVDQGILIKRGQSRPVATGTAIRVALLIVLVAIVLLVQPATHGATLVAAAVITELGVEALYIRWLARHALVRQPRAGKETTPPALAAVWHLHAPIGMSALIYTATRPLINAALAHSPQPAEAIATWAVVSAAVGLLQIPLTMIQQVAIAVHGEPAARRPLQQLTAAMGGGAAGLIVLVAASPLYEVLLGGLLGLPAALQPMGRPALVLYALAPLAMAWVSYYQGREVAERRTPDVRLGTIANLLALAGGLGLVSLMPDDRRVSGVAVAVTLAFGIEILVHAVRARRWERAMQVPAIG